VGILVPGITRRTTRPANWTLPSTPELFGPDAPAIRAGTAPLAVTHPGGSPTVVNPGDSVAAKITTAGAGGTLWFVKGQHNLAGSVAPLAGQTWLLESIAGYSRTPSDSAVLDGLNGSLNALVMSSAANVTIKGGLFRNQGNASSESWAACILHNGGTGAGGWLVQDTIIANNFNVALNFQSSNCTARRVYITNNGRYGPNFTNAVVGQQYTGTVLEYCRWSFNNTRLQDPGAQPGAGGSKFVHHPGIIIRYCWVHDNYGFGIWPDFVGSSIGQVQMIENVVENNRRSGLFFEGTRGGCVALRNYVKNNGWDSASIGGFPATGQNNVQIRIANADSTLGTGVRGNVEGNYIDFDLPQSAAIGRALLMWNHDGEPDDTKAWDVHGNQFWFRTTDNSRMGGLDNKVAGTQLWLGNNNFYENDYQLASLTPSYWDWDSGSGQGVAKTWAQWQAFGFDTTSTRTVI
jgi:hypothetical protein